MHLYFREPAPEVLIHSLITEYLAGAYSMSYSTHWLTGHIVHWLYLSYSNLVQSLSDSIQTSRLIGRN